MSPNADVQLSLRRAFRIGYYAFLSLAFAGILAIAIWFFSGEFLTGDVARVPLREFPSVAAIVTGVVVCGLCVPLFFGLWTVVGTAVLGTGFRQPTIHESLRGA